MANSSHGLAPQLPAPVSQTLVAQTQGAESINEQNMSATRHVLPHASPRDHRLRSLPEYTVQPFNKPEHTLRVTTDLPIFCDIPPTPELEGVPEQLKQSFLSKLEQLTSLLKADQCAEGIKQYRKLWKLAESSQTFNTPEVMQFLDSLYVLFSLKSGTKDIIDQLPAKDPETFIRWHLDIAGCAATGSDSLKPSKELELFCLRRAADAGSETARIHLILQLLFSQESQSPDLYLPNEALRYIKAMAANRGGKSLPLTMGHHETVINKLMALAANPTTEGRETLARELADDGDPAIQVLVVALYQEPAFGTVQIDRALTEADKLKTAGERCPRLGYWLAQAQLKTDNPTLLKQAEASLNKMAQEGYPAATRLLAKHYMQTENGYKLENLLGFASKKYKTLTEYCPDLAHTLSMACRFGSKARKRLRNWLAPEEKEQACQEFRQFAINHCSPAARAFYLAGQAAGLNKASFRGDDSDEPFRLPEPASKLLQQCRFSEDPETLVFIYIEQALRTGKGDEPLIDMAMATDPVKTCCRLLALETCTANWLYSDLEKALFNFVNKVSDLPDCWKRPESQEALYFGLMRHHNNTPDSEQYFRFASELAHGYQKTIPDSTGIYNDLKEDYGNYLMRQGKPEEAKKLFQLYKKVQAKSWGHYAAGSKIADDYSVFQKGLPDAYWHLVTFEARSKTPLETAIKYQHLLSLHDNIACDPNPAIHQEWLKACRSFVDSSGKHLTAGQTLDLSQRMEDAHKKVKNMSDTLLQQARQLTEAKAEQITLSQGSLALLETTGKATFPEETAKGITGTRSRQAIQKIRLPQARWHSHVLEHHLEAQLLAAGTAEERLECLQQLLARGKFNTPVITVLALEAMETLPAEKRQEAAECLSQLEERLTEDTVNLQDRLHKLTCEHIMALQEVLHTTPAGSDHEKLESLLEDMKARAGSENPRQLSDTLQPCLGRKERGLHEQVLMASAPFPEQLKHSASSLMEADYFLRYAEHLTRTTLSDEQTTTLRELPDNVTLGEKSKATLFSNYVLGDDCRPLVFKIAANTKVYDDYRVDALLVGLRAGLITTEEVLQNATLFARDSTCQKVLYALSAKNTGELKHYYDQLKASANLSKDLKQTSTSIGISQRKDCCDRFFVALGFKSLEMGNPELAYDCFNSGKFHYGMAMLPWKHDVGSGDGLAEHLELAASDANTDAQCRLLDWILTHSPTVKPVMKKRACRYLFSPVVVPSSERLFYQGVVELLGVSGTVDEVAGLQKIREALNSDSPIPALRLVQLTTKGLLSQERTGVDGLLLLSQKLNRYTGNLPQELKLSEPSEAWKNLAEELQAHSHKTSEPGSSCLLKAAEKLKAAVEPPETVALLPAKTLKKASMRKMPPVMAITQSAEPEKAVLAEKERKVVEELTRQIQSSDPRQVDPQKIISLLTELREIQGNRFPDISDDLLPLLPRYLPIAESYDDLIVAIFKKISTQKSSAAMINELLESFKFQFETQSSFFTKNPQSMAAEQQTLLQILPENHIVNEENIMAMSVFVAAFAPELPEKLKQIALLPCNTTFLQHLLLERSELTPNTHYSLYQSYAQNLHSATGQREKFNLSKTNEELLEIPFHDLSRYSEADIERFLLKHPHLPASSKVRLFMALDLPIKKALMTETNVGTLCEGINDLASNPRRKLNREELRNEVQNIIRGENQDISDVLSTYIGLQNIENFQLAGQLHNKMHELSDVYLQTPLEHWDGNINRLYAVEIKRRLLVSE